MHHFMLPCIMERGISSPAHAPEYRFNLREIVD